MKRVLAAIALIAVLVAIIRFEFAAGGERTVAADLPVQRVSSNATNTVGLEAPAEPDANAELAQRVAVATTESEAIPGEIVVIEVLAQNSAGVPLEGVSVTFEYLPEGHAYKRAGSFQARSGRAKLPPTSIDVESSEFAVFTWTDNLGLARFRLLKSAPKDLPARLELGWALSNKIEPLSAPLLGGRVLVTMPAGAQLGVHVTDTLGQPAAGASITAAPTGTQAFIATAGVFKSYEPQAADSNGFAVFDDLPGGEYELFASSSNPVATARQTVKLELSERRVVELRLEPPPILELCIAGTVCDEAGEPLSMAELHVRVDGGESVSVVSNRSGEFSYQCAKGSYVEVRAGDGLWDDDFLPRLQRVPFGTEDFRVRRVRKLDWTPLELAILDATTNLAVSPERLSCRRYRAISPQVATDFSVQREGRTMLLLKQHDDWHLVLEAVGYEPQDIALSGLVTLTSADSALVIKLQRSADYTDDK